MGTIAETATIRIAGEERRPDDLAAVVALRTMADRLYEAADQAFKALVRALEPVIEAFARVIPAVTELIDAVAEITKSKAQPYWARGNEFVRRRTRRLRR